MSDAGALLRDLAVPRLTGTPGHAAVRERLVRELEARALTVETLAFAASDAPLRRATAAAEAIAFAALLFIFEGAVVGQVGRGLRWALIALAAAVIVGRWGNARGALAIGANLVARRGNGAVRAWLVAHYDSKGQRLSMATRLVGFSCLAVQVPAGAALAVLLASGQTAVWLGVLALPALAGGALLSRANLRNDSPGAVDNASGVIAVLATLDRLRDTAGVGVCFTDAEEWGLQGARALVRQRPDLFRDATVVNFDGLDHQGATILFAHRPGPLVTRLAQAAGVPARRWFPALVDGVAFARVARECVTVMRGNWHTARRVHTVRDDAARLQLDGVRAAAAAVAGALAAA